jgi:hypothetical protein
MQLLINASALARGTAANVNYDALEENNIRFWEDECYDAALNAKAAKAAGDTNEAQKHANWMRHARRMADAGIARRIGR